MPTFMFSQTLEECMVVAKGLREDLRDREADENGYVGPMGVYECEIDISNIAVLIDVLNDGSDVVKRLRVSKRLIAVVAD